MRIAIVHEWFTTIAGSEKVVEQILHLFPQADVFAVYADPVTVKTTKFLQGRRVVSSFIGKLPREDGPPRQNSCRPDMILNLGTIRMNDGTVRRGIQEQDGGAVVAAGERECWRVGERNWSVSADIGTMA